MSTSANYIVAIPARYESQRLPGKALIDLNGKTLLQRVWERALASSAKQVVIATDHPLIMEAATAFGADAIMTSPGHRSGSDRIAECARIRGWPDNQVIVNLQGDEPLMPPECLEQVARLLARSALAEAASLYWPVEDAIEAADPNVVKVVMDSEGYALMFSRSTLPYARDYASLQDAIRDGIGWRRHLGLYAYRTSSLLRFSETGATPLERAEQLEQLRYLESGGRIVMARACKPIPAGVDTFEDLERVRGIISD